MKLLDWMFIISLGIIAFVVASKTLIGPRVIQGYDGLPLDDKIEVMKRQDSGLRKILRSWLFWIGVIGILISVIFS